MNGAVIGIVALRAAALALAVAGDSATSAKLHLVADAIEAGKATDDHMRLVADKLKERDVTAADWDDVIARIDADHSRLQGS